MLPQLEWYLSRQSLDLESELTEGSLIAVAVILTMLLLLLGTTFVGHDWNSGSMSNQLLFEPRRTRVWAAKGAVVLGFGLVLAGAVLTVNWTALWLLAEQRGLSIPEGIVSTGFHQVLRTSLLAAFAGLGGYALTMLFRSTVATLGILFAVSIAVPLLLTILDFEGNQRRDAAEQLQRAGPRRTHPLRLRPHGVRRRRGPAGRLPDPDHEDGRSGVLRRAAVARRSTLTVVVPSSRRALIRLSAAERPGASHPRHCRRPRRPAP